MGKVIVLGIDGAPWELVNKFRERGSLPNIDALIKGGVGSDFWSSIPAVTSPAWKCFSTGKNPGKLGAYWWTRIDFKNKRLTFNNSTDFHSKDYWDYVAESGRYCVQINMPMTYPPPKDFNGIFVSGIPALEHEDYTCPKELKEELVRKYNWRIIHESTYDANPRRYIESAGRLIESRFDLAEEYLDRADLLQLACFSIDSVQHFTWRQMKEGKGKYKDAIESIWKIIDRRTGRLRELAGEDHHFVIMSDHGFTDFQGTFYINEWLHPRYLTLKPGGQRVDRTMFDKMLGVADRLHLIPLLRKLRSERSRNAFQVKRRQEDLERREYYVWDETTAVSSAEGLIYINRDLVPDDDEYEALRERFIKELEAIVDPETGEPGIERVHRREDIYHGPYTEEAPDLVTVTKLGYEVAAHVDGKGVLWTPRGSVHNSWTGVHRPEGILIMNGPEFKEGEWMEGSNIYDLAPTLLALMGIPIPDDMDGKVLVDAFADPDRYRDPETFTAGRQEVGEHAFTEDDEQVVEDRLRSLGYM